MLNGRFQTLVYGSYAPSAANPFIGDARLRTLWQEPTRYYLFAKDEQLNRFESLAGKNHLTFAKTCGGKPLLTNHPLGQSNNLGTR